MARTSTAAPTTVPLPLPRRSRAAAPPVPLGSLTQRGHEAPQPCPACGGTQLTSLSMTLTDGTQVRFTSCRRCEHRRWESAGDELSIATVLDRTRRS
jgi:hypothetical protein